MSIPASYLITAKNLPAFFDSLITAKAPDVFTNKFIQNLDFKSTNDRLYIGVLKSLGFLDPNGVPTTRYFEFLDQTRSKIVLADAIKEAYADLFAVNTKSNELSNNDVKNKFRTLAQGQYSENVLGLMANTFTALAQYAQWDSVDLPGRTDSSPSPVKESPEEYNETEESESVRYSEKSNATQLHYNIQIHLPDTRDQSVYDSIFRSLKKHLF